MDGKLLIFNSWRINKHDNLYKVMNSKVLGIKKFYIQKNFISYIDGKGNLYVNEEASDLPAKFTPYLINDRFVIYFNKNDESSYSIDLSNNSVVKIGRVSVSFSQLKDIINHAVAAELVLDNGNYYQRYIEIDLTNGKVIQELEIEEGYGFRAKKGDFFIIASNNVIKAKESNKLKWEFDVKEEGIWFNYHDRDWVSGEIVGLLGIHKSIIWLGLRNDLILGIDIETGAVVYRFESPVSIRNEETEPSEEERLPLGRYAQLDVESEKILIIDNKKLIEIHIGSSQPEKEIFDIEESMSAFGFGRQIEQSNWKFDDEYIYFYDNGELTRTLSVRIFERKSRRVVGSTIIETECKGINLVKDFGIYQNDIYVLDYNSTLWKLSIAELLGES